MFVWESVHMLIPRRMRGTVGYVKVHNCLSQACFKHDIDNYAKDKYEQTMNLKCIYMEQGDAQFFLQME